MYRVTIYIQRAIQKPVTLLIKKNCYSYHSSSQRSLSPFWFQLLTIFSSFIEGSSSEEIFITGNSLCSALGKSKSLLSHWLPATQILRLSNLIHILLFKLLSILHVHSWHSDLSLRLWGPWSLNVLTISFVFLWVRGPAHYKNTQTPFTGAKKSARHAQFLAPCLFYPCRDYLPEVVSAPLKFWALVPHCIWDRYVYTSKIGSAVP